MKISTKETLMAVLEGIAFALLMFVWCAACVIVSDYHWN